MTPEPGSLRVGGILTPSIPPDIAVRNQRERILLALAENCAEKTFVGTTIADIVGTAGVSRATFYKHFANKTVCFQAAADDFLTELQHIAREASTDADGSESDRVRSVTAALLERLVAKPDWAMLLLVEVPSVDPEIILRSRRLVVDALEAELAVTEPPGPVGADPEIAFGRAKALLTDYVAAGEVERLPSLLPELVYIALLPYVGQDSALEQAELTT
jgi:AcrR family transcriptional regulator